MQDEDKKIHKSEDYLRMTSEIVSSFISNNSIDSSTLSDIIKTVHASLLELAPTEAQDRAHPKPAVPISRSVTPDYIICLEDGHKLKMLKRYLRTRYDMTPETYRARWRLPRDYPMVAPNHAKRCSQIAKQNGLGRKRPNS